MKSRFVFGLLLLIAALSVTACTGSAKESTLAFSVTDSGYEGLPTDLVGGIYTVTVSNDSAADADVDLIESGDATLEQFMTDFAPVLEGGPVPAYAQRVVGIGFIPAGGERTTKVAIPAANYVVLNTGGAEGSDPQIGLLKVSGESPDPKELPDAATIVARDYGFTVSGLKTGMQTVTFRNEGPGEIHHAIVMGFEEGVDEAAAKERIKGFFSEDEGETEYPEPEDIASTGVFSVHSGGTFDIELEEGRVYAVFCFIGDRAGSAPHAMAYDMYEVFTVAG